MKLLGQDFSEMPKLGWWLMWVYLLSMTVGMAVFAWNGFLFMVIFLWLYVATKDAVNAWVKNPVIGIKVILPTKFLRISDNNIQIPLQVKLPTNEGWSRFLLSMLLILITIVALPVALISTWNYGQQVTYNVIENSPFLVSGLDSLISLGHEQLPKYIPQFDLTTEQGMQQFLTQVGGQVIGESIHEGKELAFHVSAKAAMLVVSMLIFSVEAVIMAIILNLFYSYGQKLIDVHRMILTMGIEDKDVLRNVLELGERYQTMMALFFAGWFKIATILVTLLFITLSLVPLKLTFAQVVFLAFWLGVLTSIFKIGGLIATGIGCILMMFDFQVGFGWWWIPSTMTIEEGQTITTGGVWTDWGLKIFLMFLAVKSKGLLESYHLTVNIIAEKLDIPKVAIILAVIPPAMGAGLMGMAVGLNILFLIFCLYRMALEQSGKVAQNSSQPELDFSEPHSGQPKETQAS